jgi:hypothetical protein
MNAFPAAFYFPLNDFTLPQEPVLLLISPLIIYCNHFHILLDSSILSHSHWIPQVKLQLAPPRPASELSFCRPRVPQPYQSLLQDELVPHILDHLFGDLWSGLTAHQPSPCHYPRRRGRRPRQRRLLPHLQRPSSLLHRKGPSIPTMAPTRPQGSGSGTIPPDCDFPATLRQLQPGASRQLWPERRSR